MLGLLFAVPLKLDVFKEIAIRNENGDRLHCQGSTAQLLSLGRMNRKKVEGGVEMGRDLVPIRKNLYNYAWMIKRK